MDCQKDKNSIKCILFDLDGVLVDACEWHYVALNKALQEIARDVISRTEHETAFNGLPTKSKMALMAKQGRIRKDDIQRIYTRKQELTIETIKREAQIDFVKIDLHEHIGSLGIRSACVTNCSTATARMMLIMTGQLSFFDRLICNEESRNVKPHPEPYIRAMIHFGFKPEEYLIVEDSEKGIKAAYQTGCHVWCVKDATEVTKNNMAKKLDEVNK